MGHRGDDSLRGETGGSRFRHRKISVKQHLRIYRPSDLKNLDQNELQQRDVADIETGVEKHEEKEVHLNRILLRTSEGRVDKAKDYIPTPDASHTWDEFDEFYTGSFVEPKSYIKFSATVEDCCGTLYCMDEDDEAFLENEVNKGLTVSSGKDFLKEDEFELLVNSFETAIHKRQPFLSVDPESILTLDELKPTLVKLDYNNRTLKGKLADDIGLSKREDFRISFEKKDAEKSEEEVRPLLELLELYGSKVYDHWKSRKIHAKGAEIFPQLKFERPDEKEDSDPYVCFRRRDARQPRKTRRVDLVNSQKLRQLVQVLTEAKDLAFMVAKREQISSKIINDDIDIFEDRCKIKNAKRALNIKTDDIDNDLITHKRKKLSIISKPKKSDIPKEILESNHNKKVPNGKSSNKNQKFSASQKLSKQQLQALQNQNYPNASNGAYPPALGNQRNLPQTPLEQNQKSHVYVKLPTSKVPDILLEDVDNLLLNKEKNARKYVHDRMEKRKLEDRDVFFNLTDDPYNPVFDVSLPKGIDPVNAPFASIASSKFEVNKSYYVKHLSDYFKGTSKNVVAFNKIGEKLPDDNTSNRLKKLEIFDIYQAKNEILSRELPVQFRRRVGRSNIEYIDRRPNLQTAPNNAIFEQFMDFDEIEKQEQNSENVIDVYDSKCDELTRLYYQWKYDSPSSAYGSKFSDEPPKLNQISNDTQTIRFGTMLGSKSYEQLKEITLKYRQEYIAKLKQQRLGQQNAKSSNVPSKNMSKSGTPTNGISDKASTAPIQSVAKAQIGIPVTQQKSS